jgi:hypothetical protein
MLPIQKELFGQFPRRVGVPRQWWIFSEGEFDVYTSTVQGVKNVYAAVARRPLGGKLLMDKVHYDLDSTAKDVNGDWRMFGSQDLNDAEAVERMRSDEDVAEGILGDVCADARRIATLSREDDVPIVGVFSGFGIHVYQLFQERADPDLAVETTAKKYIDEASLRTYDRRIVGEVKRIMRVPNAERVTDDGQRCNIVTIPLSATELENVTPEWLIDNSYEQRVIEPQFPYRPPLEVHEDYVDARNASTGDPLLQREVGDSVELDGVLEYILTQYLKMPCMYERIQQQNPDHKVRMNSAVLMFNAGLSVDEVHDLFARIGWFDYNPKVTRPQLEQIYRERYTEMSCATLRQKGFCTRMDDPESCEAYGWKGRKAKW